LFKRFLAEVGAPGFLSGKATREKYLHDAIEWGYKSRESEIAELKAKYEGEIARLEKALSEQREKIVEKPAITPREFNLELEVKYHRSRAEDALAALRKVIAEFEVERAALAEEIAKRERKMAEELVKRDGLVEELKSRITGLESELERRALLKPAITPREFNLELEVKYHRSRAEDALAALRKVIAESEAEKAKMAAEIAKREREMEKIKEMKEKIKKIIEIVE
ncbi:MAG: hypothetical protein QXJ68_08360, partial [Methanocellales archaeon]